MRSGKVRAPKAGNYIILMDIVSFIEDQAVIRKILTHLDLWKVPERPPPKPLLQDLDDYDIAS